MKFHTYFGSLGSVLRAEMSQILLPQAQGYKIAFEGGKFFQTAFTRCRNILKMVKRGTDRPPAHAKTTQVFPADFENDRF